MNPNTNTAAPAASTPATIIRPLPKGWSIAGAAVDQVEMRPPTLGDFIEAEKDAHPGANPTAYHVALACQTIVRAGTFTGPFTIGLFKGMKPRVWFAIRQAMEDAESLGEDEQPSQAPTS